MNNDPRDLFIWEEKGTLRLNSWASLLPKALNVMNLKSPVSEILTDENDATTAKNDHIRIEQNKGSVCY